MSVTVHLPLVADTGLGKFLIVTALGTKLGFGTGVALAFGVSSSDDESLSYGTNPVILLTSPFLLDFCPFRLLATSVTELTMPLATEAETTPSLLTRPEALIIRGAADNEGDGEGEGLGVTLGFGDGEAVAILGLTPTNFFHDEGTIS